MKPKLYFTLALFFTFTCARAQTTMALNEQAYDEYERANKKMIKAYLVVLNKFEDYDIKGAAKKAFIAGQQAFLVYRNKEGKLQEKIHYGGSMTPVFKYKLLKKLTDQRTAQLVLYQKGD